MNPCPLPVEADRAGNARHVRRSSGSGPFDHRAPTDGFVRSWMRICRGRQQSVYVACDPQETLRSCATLVWLMRSKPVRQDLAAHNSAITLAYITGVGFTSETCFVLFGAKGHFQNLNDQPLVLVAMIQVASHTNTTNSSWFNISWCVVT